MKKAFTLIELLIVVAIIAILAAIAVPNFLEAQVRSKVSRAAADMRSLATAIEAYCVDNNGYILSVCPDEAPSFDPSGSHLYSVLLYPNNKADDSWIWYTKITTPISYMTNIPNDPFAKPLGVSWNNPKGTATAVAKTCPFHFYSGCELPYNGSSAATLMSRRNQWVMISNGPNLKMETAIDNSDTDCYVLYNRFGVHGGNAGVWDGRFYDPTNGTTSKGDIYRMQGPKGIMTIAPDETSRQ